MVADRVGEGFTWIMESQRSDSPVGSVRLSRYGAPKLIDIIRFVDAGSAWVLVLSRSNEVLGHTCLIPVDFEVESLEKAIDPEGLLLCAQVDVGEMAEPVQSALGTSKHELGALDS